jgi:hypothetical protein
MRDWVESGKWRVESGKWRVESGKWRVESEKLKVYPERSRRGEILLSCAECGIF